MGGKRRLRPFIGISKGKPWQGRADSLGLAGLKNISGRGGFWLPGNWPWDDEGKGVVPQGV